MYIIYYFVRYGASQESGIGLIFSLSTTCCLVEGCVGWVREEWVGEEGRKGRGEMKSTGISHNMAYTANVYVNNVMMTMVSIWHIL